VIRHSEVNHTIPVPRHNTLGKPLALIVDDEVDICFLLKDILRKKFEMCSVTSLADAKQYLQLNKPTLIFLDNKLSDGLGIDHIHSFKEQHPQTKIIMITANDSFSDREIALREGADYFINKPFSIQTILETVQTIM
jgi:DNA-binding response OmpR family regulator